jgi:tRNA1Val (adenine37-N6)-methyltransferase
MKIGTDAVLLGAWANVGRVTNLLDIGTGCGIVALMLAQRTESIGSRIVAIDVDVAAVSQASENIAGSPWSDRVFAYHDPLQEADYLRPKNGFDLCVCNPPFFNDSFPPADPQKRAARQVNLLDRDTLLQRSAQLLNPDGRLAIIIPSSQLQETVEIALQHGFVLNRKTLVQPSIVKPPKRALLEFGKQVCGLETSVLTIEKGRHEHTEEYAELTQAFHLRYATT